MDYRKHYRLLIERARDRVLSGYVEVHHVIPRCMGGSNERSNLVQLTPEEHFVAHELLCKIHRGVHSLVLAMGAMLRHSKRRRANKSYGWVKRELSIALSAFHSGRVKSALERQHIAEARRNASPRKFSAQARANMAEARRKTWEQRRANGTDKLIGQKTVATRRKNGSYDFSTEWRQRIGIAGLGRLAWNRGKPFSAETRKRQSEAAIRRWQRNEQAAVL